MSKVLLFIALTAGAGYLLRKSSRRGARSAKYERKPQTPWAALNDDVDPTL
jgi:hypothetical protein